MPGPHPPEFRRRAVELARELDEDGNRKYPIARLARDLKISESCLRNWLAARRGCMPSCVSVGTSGWAASGSNG